MSGDTKSILEIFLSIIKTSQGDVKEAQKKLGKEK
jgi:hypothetical protein